jgi:hypothetical protein
MAAREIRRELALGDVMGDARRVAFGRVAFGRVAPAAGSAEDVPEHVAAPERRTAFRGQFAHLPVVRHSSIGVRLEVLLVYTALTEPVTAITCRTDAARRPVGVWRV